VIVTYQLVSLYIFNSNAVPPTEHNFVTDAQFKMMLKHNWVQRTRIFIWQA